MCSCNRGNIEGTNSSKICVWCLCIHVCFVFVKEFAYDPSLTVLRWPCVVDRTLKSNYYYPWDVWNQKPFLPVLQLDLFSIFCLLIHWFVFQSSGLCCCFFSRAKEKADVDRMKLPSTRDFFKDQKSFDDKMSIEMVWCVCVEGGRGVCCGVCVCVL